MTIGVILVATVIFLCILADKFSNRFGMPTLILFMFIGMLFGSDGIVKIPFDDYHMTEYVCSSLLCSTAVLIQNGVLQSQLL